jgi:hypothetical protein
VLKQSTDLYLLLCRSPPQALSLSTDTASQLTAGEHPGLALASAVYRRLRAEFAEWYLAEALRARCPSPNASQSLLKRL